MSYNLLADLYTSQTSSSLWTYLPPKFLTIFYRLPQLIHEIISTQSTVILLQEVDQKHYRNYIYPVLKKLGYEGTFGKKYGNQTEGLSTFYKLSPYITLTSPPTTSKLSSLYGPINSYLSSSPPLSSIMIEKLGTIYQLTTLNILSTPINICNVHLFYHPLADHIRLLQVKCVIRELDCCGDVVFGGDFNSDYRSGGVRLIEEGKVVEGMECWERVWRDLNTFTWNTSPSPVSTLLPLPLNSSSRFKLSSGVHSFTNYALDFIEQLDYIFVRGRNIRIVGHAECVGKEEVGDKAMPNERMGSDHLSVVCDLRIGGG
ncbi:hypothetical protein TrVE_jg7856 [Triparma verrucosa]|uniref:Endonuclease/exonuclease/phosphatase domain-containing protein n=1 Tax=Triparma verrucosa TaxID=1606542 RepID=A0A9W7BGC3_9STRA|nr:hypothetical protein TrVE_jg7856 [Triparma verrucosa]